MAFIKQKEGILLKLYPILRYSVPDTTIFITIGSVSEVIKYVKACKINRFRLDRIGRMIMKETWKKYGAAKKLESLGPIGILGVNYSCIIRDDTSVPQRQ